MPKLTTGDMPPNDSQQQTQQLIPMGQSDIEATSALIGLAMNAEEEEWARTTFQRHFTLGQNGIHDGRTYYLLKQEGDIVGITGLHHYEWGPKENVWLGWFALHPEMQGKGVGKALMEMTLSKASDAGYMKLFIETYSSPTFQQARNFYSRCGFKKAGEVQDYLANGVDMIVFSRDIHHIGRD